MSLMKKTISSLPLKLAFVILLSVGNVIYWGTQKEGFHLDEMFSYEQVGNTEYPKPQFDRPDEPCMNTWHSREYYEDYLVISSDEAFDITAFYRSASKNDAHPPIYLVLLGMFISAVSPNHFTKWSGLALNIIFFILTLLVIYDISRRLLKKEKLALLAVFLSGISVGMVSTSVFIRPYMLLTLFVVAFVDIHIRMIGQKRQPQLSSRKRISQYIGLALLFIGGSLSHYYFLIFAFFLCLSYWLALFFAKERRPLWEYTLVIAGSFFAYLFMWPEFYRDLLFQQRGIEAAHNFVRGEDNYIRMVTHYFRQIDLQTMGGFFIALLAVVIVAVIIQKIRMRPVKLQSSGSEDRQDWLMFVLLFFPVVCYVLVVARIAPYYPPWLKATRYISCIYPLCTMMEIFLIMIIIHRYLNNRFLLSAIGPAMIILTSLGYLTGGVMYIYQGDPSIEDQMEQLSLYDNDRAVFVAETDFLVSGLNVYLVNHESVYQTNYSGIPNISDALEGYENDTLVLYISEEENAQEVIDILSRDLDATGCRHLFKTAGDASSDVFVMKLQR